MNSKTEIRRINFDGKCETMKKKPIESFSHLLKISAAVCVSAAVVAFAASGLMPRGASMGLPNVQSGTVSVVQGRADMFSGSVVQESSREELSEQPLININAATAEELQELSGIRQAKAAAIVAYREEHGAFSDISEIKRVNGIGNGIFEKIRANITV